MDKTTRYAISAAILTAADLMWILFYMGPKYKTLVKKIQGSDLEANMASIVGAYVLMIVGLFVFVLPRSVDTGSALRWGLLFGLVVYGIFDLTNGGIFSRWNFRLALLDMAWGSFVYAAAALTFDFLTKRYQR